MRFTIRRLMILIALTAPGCGGADADRIVVGTHYGHDENGNPTMTRVELESVEIEIIPIGYTFIIAILTISVLTFLAFLAWRRWRRREPN